MKPVRSKCITTVYATAFCVLMSASAAFSQSPTKPISFNNDIEPILTRAGCNQGSCHGSQFGKGGFKLSLAAYDPDFDYTQITRQAGGRRVARTVPSESLLLKKPA